MDRVEAGPEGASAHVVRDVLLATAEIKTRGHTGSAWAKSSDGTSLCCAALANAVCERIEASIDANFYGVGKAEDIEGADFAAGTWLALFAVGMRPVSHSFFDFLRRSLCSTALERVQLLDITISLQRELHQGLEPHATRVATEAWELSRWLVFGIEREPPEVRGGDRRSQERRVRGKEAKVELVGLRLPPPQDDAEALSEWRELSDVAQSLLANQSRDGEDRLLSLGEARNLAYRTFSLWLRYLTDVDCRGSWRHVPGGLNPIIRFSFASVAVGRDRAPWTPIESLCGADFDRLGEDVDAQRVTADTLTRVSADCLLLRTMAPSRPSWDSRRECEAEVRCEQIVRFLAIVEIGSIARTHANWRKVAPNCDSAGLDVWAPRPRRRPPG